MVNRRYKDTFLYVRAIGEANVREIDEFGRPLLGAKCRFVGKIYEPDSDSFEVDWCGVYIPYHSHYIARLKEGTLLPMDAGTAILAGVRFQ
jgi:hypothetical protein